MTKTEMEEIRTHCEDVFINTRYCSLKVCHFHTSRSCGIKHDYLKHLPKDWNDEFIALHHWEEWDEES